MPALGRIVEHDPKSRFYQAAMAVAPRSVLWGHHAPVLDQGNVGSCTGNALAQALNCDYFAKCRSHYLTENDALTLYSAATQIDDVPGIYPPDDTGSSGLAVAKAGVKAGYLTGYKHAFGFAHFVAALQLQPVIVGTSWHEGMFTPDKSGLVRPTGPVAGGHEYLAIGVDYTLKSVTFLNSWGDKWGQHGRFHMTFGDFTALLADQGDVVAPVPAKV